ncbi:class I SAM-dependent RNA methyltransferase [Saccharothrix coeruleofusca]|uniref:23S rRNA methyltransferase n=1 Tax=Saccharothrix coeruleofusca TaxID=33919 RepID=A0A918ECZ5_9PSEU|nr:class I SAM-dependent RNA methyltransferase [Saccharothrix coeruleofusca]MBP2334548.1 tRNA/tmRNA/rRNA uracil-C5-methylase (TrmA/RlmC/RlmD family) [Saccharothrix coeruleofusca]GGP40221.1 23S rRNA methyltransferase [Saccharothrix coeruleofusca]
MKATWEQRLIEVEVGAVAHGGHCVARHEGRVVFVRHALPGERVVVRITEDSGGSFCRGDAVEVLVASDDRVQQPCPFAGPGLCGGCDWQHATPQAQLELKAAVVAEQLRRLAGLERRVVVEPLPGGAEDWRTRMRLAVDAEGRAGFRKHRSHEVVPVDHCVIAVPDALDDVVDRTWPAGAELVVTRDAGGQVHLTEVGPPERRRGRQVPGPARRRRGSGTATELAAGRAWNLRADGFWQVHPAAADTFAKVVAEWADCRPGQRAWDLYGGVGLFASVLAEQVGATGSVAVVEYSTRAVQDGRRNLSDLPQVSWYAGKTEEVLRTPEFTDLPPDVVVLDPPRKGAGRAVVTEIARSRPERVVYVACDPAALARDIASFAQRGYDLAQLRAFDAFPMTHHVECVALLEPAR